MSKSLILVSPSFRMYVCIRSKPAAALLLIENRRVKRIIGLLLYLTLISSVLFTYRPWILFSRTIFIDSRLVEQKMHAALFLTLFIGLITYGAASDVLVFTDSDFETKIKQYDVALAEFYAPWCGHCKCFRFDFLSISIFWNKANDWHRSTNKPQKYWLRMILL